MGGGFKTVYPTYMYICIDIKRLYDPQIGSALCLLARSESTRTRGDTAFSPQILLYYIAVLT